MMLQGDHQKDLRAIPREAISPADRVARMRQRLLVRSVGTVLPAASRFFESIQGHEAPEEVRQSFVAASLATQQALEICVSGGLLTKQTVAAASTMMGELRKGALDLTSSLHEEAEHSIDAMGAGVAEGMRMSSDEEMKKFYANAQTKLEWLRKLADQTLKVKRPDLAVAPAQKRDISSPSLH